MKRGPNTSRTGMASHLHFRRKVLTRDRNNGVTHCPICLVELDYETTRTPRSAEPDHIIPHAHGGTDHPSNGRTICRLCNQRKGNGRRTGRPGGADAKPVKTLAAW